MPATGDEDEEEEAKETRHVVAVLVACLLAGLVLVVVSFIGLRSEAVWTFDRLVVFDAAWREGWEKAVPVLTTRRIFQVLLFVGLLVVLSAIIGILGARTRHRSLVCTYVVLAAAFTALMAMSGIQTIQRKSVVEPLVSRQVLDLCNSSTYMHLAANIPCAWASDYDPSDLSACNTVCQWRVGLLRQLHGCVVMPKLCTQFFYEELDTAGCADALSSTSPRLYGASENGDSCRDLCDADIKCALYAYSGASAAKPQRCLLGAGVALKHQAPRWVPVLPGEVADYLSGGSSLRCFRRSTPRILERFQVHGTRLAACTLLLSVCLLVATVCTCCLMYNVTIKRRGRPKAVELVLMMCFPCCTGELQRRYNHPELSDLESDEDDEQPEVVLSRKS